MLSLEENVKLREGTPPGTYNFKVRVTDSLFPGVEAVSSVEVYIEELEKDAMLNAIAIRIKGIRSDLKL